MRNLKSSIILMGVIAWGLAIIPCESKAVVINDLIIVAANDVKPEPFDGPVGQTGKEASLLPEDAELASSSDILGTKGGYFHPYLNIYGEWTDNVYNDEDGDEIESWVARVSPGVWFALPRKKVIPIALAPHNTSPGGLQNQLEEQVYTDRFMSYALLGGDFKFFNENSNLDDIDYVAEGLIRYNMAGGLSLQLVDRYTVAEDVFGYETVTRDDERPRFDSNFLMATIDWDITEKLNIKFDYTNFNLAYDEVIDQYKDRVDNGFDLYGTFHITDKTSLFLQYAYVDVSYDEATENDSTQDFYYGGIRWRTTEKLAMMLKIGLQERDFDIDDQNDSENLTLDFQLNYKYSEKTSANVAVYKENEETDSTVATDKDVIGARLGYKQAFTEKLAGSLDIRYEDADYNQQIDTERDEQTIRVRPAVQYTIQEWLQLELAYEYEDVTSTQDIFEYTSNTVMFGVNLAM